MYTQRHTLPHRTARMAIAALAVLCGCMARAQSDSVLLTKNFKFRDGLYRTFESLRHNRPDYGWDSIKANLYTNPQTCLTQVDYLRVGHKKQTDTLDPASFWGLCIAGIPYVRLPKGAVHKDWTVFACLQVRGSICYFSYPETVVKKVYMPVYNPATGRIFREGYVDRKMELTKEKLLNFGTGEIADFTLENFRHWIRDDQQLLNSIASLTPEEVKEKLFKCLLIYDDRHKIYLK